MALNCYLQPNMPKQYTNVAVVSFALRKFGRAKSEKMADEESNTTDEADPEQTTSTEVQMGLSYPSSVDDVNLTSAVRKTVDINPRSCLRNHLKSLVGPIVIAS